MPGTILVSVLEFKGLQSSSSTPQQISIKVSMGKREYQCWDKEEFSFPLTTLSDNLAIALYDSKGNIISHTGVETRLVIEKGLWDDVFSLEGGGHVHLRFQFVLSEEERCQIRAMRESALRKKLGELPSGNPTSPVIIGSNAESPLFLNHEVSDSHASLLQSKLVVKPAGFDPIDTRRIDQPPVSQGFDVHLTELSIRGFVEKLEAKTPQADVSVRAIGSKEASSLSGSSELIVAAKSKLIAQKLGEAGTNYKEKQIPVMKSLSNVRNMITAFESSLSQDIQPCIKPAPAKSQLRKTSSEASRKSFSADEFKAEKIKPAELMPIRIKTPFVREDSQQATTYNRTTGDQLGYVKVFDGPTTQGTRKFELNAADVKTNVKTADMNNKLTDKAVEIEKGKNSSEGLMRESSGKAATVSGRTLDELLGRQHHSKVLANKQHYSSKCPGTWMFPTESRSLCITAGGKYLMDLLEICHAEAKIHRKKCSGPQNVEKGSMHHGCNKVQGSMHHGCNKVKEVDKSNKKARKPELVNSADDETSRGPVGQVMKVAVMIGFATLVLFTRQRNIWIFDEDISCKTRENNCIGRNFGVLPRYLIQNLDVTVQFLYVSIDRDLISAHRVF